MFPLIKSFCFSHDFQNCFFYGSFAVFSFHSVVFCSYNRQKFNKMNEKRSQVIVFKGVSTLPPPISKSSPPLLGSPPFLKIPHSPTLLANWSSQVFLINRKGSVKLSSMNTIHVKQRKHWLFHFQGYSKVHAR